MCLLSSKIYVGIDVHSREHVVAVVPLRIFQEYGANWAKIKTFSIKNSYDYFTRLKITIGSYTENLKTYILPLIILFWLLPNWALVLIGLEHLTQRKPQRINAT